MDNKRLNHYLKSGHRYVNGWLRPGAADAVVALSANQVKSRITGGVAEIGVHHGKLFILLYLLAGKNEPAVAIDLFSHQELNIDHSGLGDLEKFKSNLRRFADTNRLIIHEGDSTQLSSSALLALGNSPFRLISIDGGHTPEITAHDISTAEGALTEGGIIILDDCFTEVFPGVCEGVVRYFIEPRTIVPFAIGAGKTFFCHAPFAEQYKQSLRRMKAKMTEHGFLGAQVLCLEFARPTLAERIGRMEAWRSIKHLAPAQFLRKLYHKARPLLIR